MRKIVVINSSTRAKNPHSRALTKLFVETWSKKHPEDTYTYREVGLIPIPHITNEWIGASFTEVEDRTEEIIKSSGLPNTILRATQFHDFVYDRILNAENTQAKILTGAPRSEISIH